MRTKNYAEVLSIFLVVTLLNVYWLNHIPLKVHADPGQDLIIGDDETVYVVTGNEEWRDIIILGTGKLVVPSGTTLNTSNIYMQSGSVFETTGGVITFLNASNSADVHFNGTCAYFNVTDFSIINMRGSDGYADTSNPGPYDAYIPVSMGGDAELNITTNEGLRIENSTINVTGGNGFDLPPSTGSACNAWTNGVDIGGYIAVGGNATICMNSLHPMTPLMIDNSTLNTRGGFGGKAADGGDGGPGNKGGEGGGYAGGPGGLSEMNGKPGGNVSGFVGSGGSTKVILISVTDINVLSSSILSNGGRGGNGGEGGNSAGGGYGGGGGGGLHGDGANSGIVTGLVGTGGNSDIFFMSSNFIKFFNSTVETRGGNGGDAGDGGNGGGGGYGGGGGTGYLGDGGDGTVYDFVGAGGSANITLFGNVGNIVNTIFYSIGGKGGNAGDGNNSDDSGSVGGGGGYGGGGRGDLNNELVGDGKAYDYVGSGGVASLFFKINTTKFMTSALLILGGDGGDAGDGGKREGAGSGAGGGGYGGGGGGTNAFGGDGIAADYVGTGGDAVCDIHVGRFVYIDSNITTKGGKGGDGGVGGSYSAPGGGGAGGGGYAGGGGGGGGAYHGGDGYVYGHVGDGGNASLTLNLDTPSISRSSIISVLGGKGGYGPTSKGGGGSAGGAGTGRTTSDGSVFQFIPMSISLLLFPENETFTNSTPTFTWLHLHNSTMNGPLSNYTIEIDNNLDFFSPEIVETTTAADYIPTLPLFEGTYYWRVKANYSTPSGSSAGWSEIWTFTVSLLAPTNLSILVDYIGGEITLNWTRPLSPTLDHYLIYRSSDPHDFNFATPYNNSLTWPDPLAANWIDPDINEGSNDANYFYIVRGINDTGFEEQNMNIVGKYVSWLSKGWNLVSTPLKQYNNSVEQVLSSIAGSYRVVYWYSAIDGKWHHSNGDLTNIDHKMGFWIYMDSLDKLITNGSVVDSVIHLNEGWNLVGYPSFIAGSVDSIFSDVPFFNAIQCYNNSDTNDHWKHHSEKKFSGNDLTIMRSCFGYWVYVTSDSDWHVDY